MVGGGGGGGGGGTKSEFYEVQLSEIWFFVAFKLVYCYTLHTCHDAAIIVIHTCHDAAIIVIHTCHDAAIIVIHMP